MHRSASVGVLAGALVGLMACHQGAVTTASQAPSPASAQTATQAGSSAAARATAGRGGQRGARPAATRAPRKLTHADSVRMAADSAAAAFYLARERRRDSISHALTIAQRTASTTADLTVPIVFDVRSAEIRSAEHKALDRRVAILRANPALHIRIDGTAHDDVSKPANLALGMRRATAVKQYLTDHGIAADRIETTANPEADPECAAGAKTCWDDNRKDDILITAGGAQLTPP